MDVSLSKPLSIEKPPAQRGVANFSIDPYTLAALLQLPKGYYITGLFSDGYSRNLVIRVESDNLPQPEPQEMMIPFLPPPEFHVEYEIHGNSVFAKYSIKADWLKVSEGGAAPIESR